MRVRHTALIEKNEIVLREDYVGKARLKICYPNISSCITITAVTNNSLVGAHIPYINNQEYINEIFSSLKSLAAFSHPDFYVIGAISTFKNFKRLAKNELLNTKNKIAKLIRKSFQPSVTVNFFDTSRYQDVHILIERQHDGIHASWIRSYFRAIYGFDYPSFFPATIDIPLKTFETR